MIKSCFNVLSLAVTGACLCFSVVVNAENFFSTQELARIKSHGPWPPTVPPDPGNEYTGVNWAEEAGKLLFQDPRLSGAGDISCATCHQQANGFTDQRAVAVGREIHVRNTQTLLNAGLQRWFGWDGGTDSLWAAAMRPLLSEIEMAASVSSIAKYLRGAEAYQRFLRLTPDSEQVDIEEITDEALAVKAAKLIAAYVRTIRSGVTAFDRYRNALVIDKDKDRNKDRNTGKGNGKLSESNDFSASAKRGLKLFIGDANCHLCHYGANFSNGEFHDVGRPFITSVGQVDPGRYSGIERVRTDRYNLVGRYNGTDKDNEIRKTRSVERSQADWGRWRTPGLRGLIYTAPYMHDGSIATLRDVVDAYSDIDPDRLHTEGESILRPLNLSEQQRQDLVAFLESLSSLVNR